jgi:hypothetical protein
VAQDAPFVTRAEERDVIDGAAVLEHCAADQPIALARQLEPGLRTRTSPPRGGGLTGES